MGAANSTQLPPQSTPPLDDRGGDASLPPLFSRVWWLFFNGLNGAVSTLFDLLDATALTIPPKTQRAKQVELAILGPTLKTDTLVEVTDYAHVLRWTGFAFVWGPGDTGSGMLAPFAAAPTGSGWHLCDGSAGVKYLKADGTTGTLTLPNTAGSAAYLKLGPAYTNVITAATVPTVTNPANTGAYALTVNDIPSHAHGLSQVKFNTTYATTGASVGLNGTGSAISQITDVQGGGLAHQHTIAASTATLPGDPIANFSAPLYFRQ